MIDDVEMRGLYKAESEEHLQTLENGLLRLEADPQDVALLEEIFRSAHSLKGASRMLGVSDVEVLAHHFEDELGTARRGHIVLSQTRIDSLYQGLDAMRQLVREACGEEATPVDVPRALARLRGEESAPEPPRADAAPLIPETADARTAGEASTTTPAPDGPAPDNTVPPNGSGNTSVNDDAYPLQAPIVSDVSVTRELEHYEATQALPEVKDAPVTSLKTSAPGTFEENPAAVDTLAPMGKDSPAVGDETQSLVSPSAFTIDTIRVKPQKLDVLMTLAGEMAVTTTRLARSLTVVDDLMALWEEWDRDVALQRSLRTNLPDEPAFAGNDSSRRHFTRFQEREAERLKRMQSLLSHLERTRHEEVARLDLVADELGDAIRNLRLLPISTVFNLFPRLVRDLSRDEKKEVHLVIEGGSVTADKHLLEAIKDPLMHLLRNAIDHGVELPEERLQHGKEPEATLWLRAYQTATDIVVEIEDNGRGLDEEAIRRAALQKRVCSPAELAALSPEQVRMLIFAPGFSTNTLITDVSGRGVGLDVVRTNIERLKGTISVKSVPREGCTFRMRAPLTLGTARVLLVQVAQQTYAVPVEAVQETCRVPASSVFSLAGRPTIRQNDQLISVASLSDLLQLPAARTGGLKGNGNGGPNATNHSLRSCIILSLGADKLGIFVDALIDEQEVVLKPFGGLLKRVRNVSAATILSSGDICMVLNPQDLIKTAKGATVMTDSVPREEAERRKVLLLAEDSITTRTQEKRILESAGYEVVTAVDGADAFNKLGTRVFDAVISDVEMPNMNGLTLASRIREDPKYNELPIILVTSLASDEDRQRGSEAGANAYITKGTFEQKLLLDTVRRLV